MTRPGYGTMLRIFIIAMGVTVLGLVTGIHAGETKFVEAPGRTMAKQATKSNTLWITADHSQHEALKRPFKSGPEITATCISCHTEAEKQLHKTIH